MNEINELLDALEAEVRYRTGCADDPIVCVACPWLERSIWVLAKYDRCEIVEERKHSIIFKWTERGDK